MITTIATCDRCKRTINGGAWRMHTYNVIDNIVVIPALETGEGWKQYCGVNCLMNELNDSCMHIEKYRPK